MIKYTLFTLTIVFFSCKETSLGEKEDENIEKIFSTEPAWDSKEIQLKVIKTNRVMSDEKLENVYLYPCVISKMGQLKISALYNNNIINDYNIEALNDTTHVKIVRLRFENVERGQLFYDLSRKFNCPTSLVHNFLENGFSEYFIIGKYIYIIESYNFLSTQKVAKNLRDFLMFKRELKFKGMNLDSIHLYRY